MKTSRLASGALGVIAAVAFLAGCGGGLQPSSSFASSGAQGLASGERALGPMGHTTW